MILYRKHVKKSCEFAVIMNTIVMDIMNRIDFDRRRDLHIEV